MKNRNKRERGMKGIFFLSSSISIIGLVSICFFIFSYGLPFIAKIGIKDFIFGTQWAPTNSDPKYGILPMIFGSFWATFGALLIGAPLGIGTAVFIQYYLSPKIRDLGNVAVQLMASIPSIVYGFFTLTVVVPYIRKIVGGTGMSLFTASLLLAVMILPTIISLSKVSLQEVPKSIFDGSLALGASKEETILKVGIPYAFPGILSSVILGVGRAMGETMAVLLIAGNQARIPHHIFDGVRTLTTNIVLEMSYASGDHRLALIATGAVLFIFILLVNLSFHLLSKKVRL